MQKVHIAISDKPVALYSLDVIISVGYRVKSKRGVQFRQWASNILKQYLIQGYTLNQARLHERVIEFEQALDLLSKTLANQQLVNPVGKAVLGVINDYARTWSLLQGYDEESLADASTKQQAMQPLGLDNSLAAIKQLKAELISKGEATELFAQLRSDGLASALLVAESKPEQKEMMIRLTQQFILLKE